MNDNELTIEQLEILYKFHSKLCGIDIEYLITKNNIDINMEDLMPIANKLIRMFEE